MRARPFFASTHARECVVADKCASNHSDINAHRYTGTAVRTVRFERAAPSYRPPSDARAGDAPGYDSNYLSAPTFMPRDKGRGDRPLPQSTKASLLTYLHTYLKHHKSISLI